MNSSRIISVKLLRALLVPCFFFTNGALLHAKEQPPTTNLTYMGSMPGARQMAMGYAFCAVADDPSAVYYNPAGLAFITKNYLSTSFEAVRQSALTTDEIFQAEMLRNRNLIFLALVSPKGALSWRPLADSVWTDARGGNWAKNEFKVNMYTLSAGHKHSDTFYSGLNLSYIGGQIAQARIVNGIPDTNLADGSGFTTDLGLLFVPAERLHIGINMQNLFGMVWWDDFDNEQLPFILKTGFSFQLAQLFTFTTEWEKRYFRKAGSEDTDIVHFGLEQNLGKILQVRAGAYGNNLNDNETAHFTAGFGYKQKGFAISLAGERYRLNGTDVAKYLFSLDIPMETSEKTN